MVMCMVSDVHRGTFTCSSLALLAWWYHCLLVAWFEQGPYSSLHEQKSQEDNFKPPIQAKLAALALQRIAVYSLTKSELHLKVLQVDLQPMAVPAEGVRLLKLSDGLAVLPVFIGRRTLATILAVVLEVGQLHCLPPAMST